MISWVQTTFQKHIKVFLVLLLLLLIIPFVFTIGANPGIGQGDLKAKRVEIFGVPFTSDAERSAFYREGQLSFYLLAGQAYYDPSRIQSHSFRRAASLKVADDLGIPAPTAEQVTDFIRSLPAFAGEGGGFDAAAYARFRDEMAANPQISQTNISRVLSDDWRVDQVSNVLGGPGYVLDAEIEQALARADTKWTVETATVDTSTVEQPAEPSEEELRAWFEANKARYRIPERVKVSYLEFPSANYVSSVELKDEEIVRYFEQNRSRYTPPAPQIAEGETPPPPAVVELGDVRDQVVRDLTASRARTLASKAAADFAYILFDKKIARGTEAFDRLVSAQRLEMKSPAAFAANEVPSSTGWSNQIATEAFRLSERRPVSDPLPVGDNAIVLFFDERIPPTDAELFAVRDRVAADIRENKRREAVTAKGEALRTRLADALGAGKSFADAAKEAGLETKKWEDFSLRELPQDIDYSILGRLEELQVNEVSPMSVQGTRGVLVIVTARTPPELSPASAGFEEARVSMMRQSSQATGQGIISDMVEKELLASGLAEKTE